MIKELLHSLDYSLFGEIALLIFLIVFVAIVLRVFLGDRRQFQRYGDIVLSEAIADQETDHES
ncbi:MAG TPA: hypothetical protein PKD54_03080 [Pirellulaceae bacterium]|nr:hypothetical protein [Pirellulaceae bacterium]